MDLNTGAESLGWKSLSCGGQFQRLANCRERINIVHVTRLSGLFCPLILLSDRSRIQRSENKKHNSAQVCAQIFFDLYFDGARSVITGE